MTNIDTIRANGTLLVFAGIGIPPYSCRGATQSLTPIAQSAQYRRTLNGALRDISQPEFHKYASTISCKDVQSPALSGVWPGRVVVVDCFAELAYLTASGSPERTVVPGSSRVEGLFTFYRPRLEMMITSLKPSVDEWANETAWSIDLEET